MPNLEFVWNAVPAKLVADEGNWPACASGCSKTGEGARHLRRGQPVRGRCWKTTPVSGRRAAVRRNRISWPMSRARPGASVFTPRAAMRSSCASGDRRVDGAVCAEEATAGIWRSRIDADRQMRSAIINQLQRQAPAPHVGGRSWRAGRAKPRAGQKRTAPIIPDNDMREKLTKIIKPTKVCRRRWAIRRSRRSEGEYNLPGRRVRQPWGASGEEGAQYVQGGDDLAEAREMLADRT